MNNVGTFLTHKPPLVEGKYNFWLIFGEQMLLHDILLSKKVQGKLGKTACFIVLENDVASWNFFEMKCRFFFFFFFFGLTFMPCIIENFPSRVTSFRLNLVGIEWSFGLYLVNQFKFKFFISILFFFFLKNQQKL